MEVVEHVLLLVAPPGEVPLLAVLDPAPQAGDRIQAARRAPRCDHRRPHRRLGDRESAVAVEDRRRLVGRTPSRRGGSGTSGSSSRRATGTRPGYTDRSGTTDRSSVGYTRCAEPAGSSSHADGGSSKPFTIATAVPDLAVDRDAWNRPHLGTFDRAHRAVAGDEPDAVDADAGRDEVEAVGHRLDRPEHVVSLRPRACATRPASRRRRAGRSTRPVGAAPRAMSRRSACARRGT